MADLARGRLKANREALTAALTRLVGPHQRFLLKELLAHIYGLDAHLAILDAEIRSRVEEYEELIALLDSIPIDGRQKRSWLKSAPT